VTAGRLNLSGEVVGDRSILGSRALRHLNFSVMRVQTLAHPESICRRFWLAEDDDASSIRLEASLTNEFAPKEPESRLAGKIQALLTAEDLKSMATPRSGQSSNLCFANRRQTTTLHFRECPTPLQTRKITTKRRRWPIKPMSEI
jgi:hypothetical protein